MLAKDSLDFSRVDVLATGDYEIIPSVDDVEIAVAVEVAQISSAKPAVVQITGFRRMVANVTGNDCWSPDFDLADFPRRRDSRLNDDPNFGEWKRHAR